MVALEPTIPVGVLGDRSKRSPRSERLRTQSSSEDLGAVGNRVLRRGASAITLGSRDKVAAPLGAGGGDDDDDDDGTDHELAVANVSPVRQPRDVGALLRTPDRGSAAGRPAA